MSQALAHQPRAEAQGFISIWGCLSHADVMLWFANPAKQHRSSAWALATEKLGL